MPIKVEITHHFFKKIRERIADLPDEKIFETLTGEEGYREGTFCKEHVLVGGGSGLYLPYAGILVPLIQVHEPEKRYRAVTVYRSLPPESLGIKNTKQVKIRWNRADYRPTENAMPPISEILEELSASSF